MLELEGDFRSAETGFEERLSRLTSALGTSPFFRRVRILTADRPQGGELGEFEAVLELVAAQPLPWEARP